MSARRPKNGVEKCPHCGKKQGDAVLLSVTSRVYSNFECNFCGYRYTTDAVSGRFIRTAYNNEVH